MKYETFTTEKGTVLPLLNLRGKAYMQVAHRLVWFTEAVPSYTTYTEFLVLTENETVAKVTVNILDAAGRVVKSVTATKREDSKGFPDHLEKAETGALGRGLAILGYGTQFAIADLEENDRLADSPVAVPTETAKPAQAAAPKAAITVESKPAAATPKPFSRTKPTAAKPAVVATEDDGL